MIDVEIRSYDKYGRLIDLRKVLGKLTNKNYRTVMARLMEAYTANLSGAIDSSGVARYFRRAPDTNTMMYIDQGLDCIRLAYGTGTTPPTRLDYHLENELGYFNPTASETVTSTETEISRRFTGSTVLATSVDIYEVGMYVLFRTSAGTDSWFLYDRTVLAEPVTVPAEGVLAIAYTIKVSIP